MLRSLFSGISGLRAHQTMLDVVGNNIANVNTVGYKSSSVVFEDTLSQLLQGATTPTAINGGADARQVGLGVRVAGISTNWTDGATETTGVSTDLAIDGDGLFAVQRGGNTYYTRNGSFQVDANGNLVDTNGDKVMGWTADGSGNITTNGSTSPIKLSSKLLAPVQTGTLDMTGNLPASSDSSTSIAVSTTGYDSQGTAVPLTMTYSNPTMDDDGNTTWDIAVTNDDGTITGSGSVTFDASGNLSSDNPTSIDLTNDGDTAWTATSLNLDMANVTQYGSDKTIGVANQDGSAAGSLESYSIGNDGTITGVFSNGLKQALGQIALATFTNPGGLEKVGDSLYTTTTNSGNAILGIPGTGGRGTLDGGTLEMSNVDLSTEFSNLIIAQRGFEANSKVITTSDQVLGDLMQLKQ